MPNLKKCTRHPQNLSLNIVSADQLNELIKKLLDIFYSVAYIQHKYDGSKWDK